MDSANTTPSESAAHPRDVYRPDYHFTPPAGWMNDPNGLVFYEGEYHLFYQHRFLSHWGHAVSTDLLDWTHLPIALAPDERGMIASGSAVVDWEDRSGLFGGGSGLVAIFTHWRDDAQEQSIAYSSDKGRTWVKYSGNPVVANPGIRDFRDPKVIWHAPTAKWVMVVAVYDRVHFYVSPDLKQWEFTSEFGAQEGCHAGVWECPDLFELPVDGENATKWTLHISINSRTSRAMQYFIGTFDGCGFVNENPAADIRWTDYGEDYYAAVSWFNLAPGDARRVWIGWINNWRYAKNVPTAPWQGAMSIPRQVGLKRMGTDLRLVQRPIAELAALRGQGYRWNDLALAPGQNPLSELRGTSLEIIAEIECAAAQVVGFRLRQGVQTGVAVAYDVQAASIFVDRTGADVLAFDPNFPGKHAAPLDALGGRIMLHLFLDVCSVEVFGNDGDVVITDLIFPNPDDDRLELFAVGGTAIIRSLVVYRFGQIQRDFTAGAAGPHALPPTPVATGAGSHRSDGG